MTQVRKPDGQNEVVGQLCVCVCGFLLLLLFFFFLISFTPPTYIVASFLNALGTNSKI